MESMNITNARTNFYKLVSDVSTTHIPVEIVGKDASAVLISKEDWNAIQETLYLQSIPGMMESINKGAAEPLEDCTPEEEIDWDEL